MSTPLSDRAKPGALVTRFLWELGNRETDQSAGGWADHYAMMTPDQWLIEFETWRRKRNEEHKKKPKRKTAKRRARKSGEP